MPSGCCVRSITSNEVTSSTHTHTHTHARAHAHTPQSVQENDEYKIFWDFNIQTDKVIEHSDQT